MLAWSWTRLTEPCFDPLLDRDRVTSPEARSVDSQYADSEFASQAVRAHERPAPAHHAAYEEDDCISGLILGAAGCREPRAVSNVSIRNS